MHTEEVEYLSKWCEEVEYMIGDYNSVSKETHHWLVIVDSTNE